MSTKQIVTMVLGFFFFASAAVICTGNLIRSSEETPCRDHRLGAFPNSACAHEQHRVTQMGVEIMCLCEPVKIPEEANNVQ